MTSVNATAVGRTSVPLIACVEERADANHSDSYLFLVRHALNTELNPVTLALDDVKRISVYFPVALAARIQESADQHNMTFPEAAAGLAAAAAAADAWDMSRKDDTVVTTRIPAKTAISKAFNKIQQRVFILAELGFTMEHETAKARLWSCPFGKLWEIRAKPIEIWIDYGFNDFAASGFHQKIAEAIGNFPLAEVAVIEATEKGVRVAFMARTRPDPCCPISPIIEEEEKTAWLPKVAITVKGGVTYAEARQLQQHLDEARKFGQRAAGRRKAYTIKQWEPILAQHAPDVGLRTWLLERVAARVLQIANAAPP